MPRIREARVDDTKVRGPGLREISFGTLDGPLPYQAGQWLSFNVADGDDNDRGAWRVYSFSSSPHEVDNAEAPDRFRVLVDVDGPGPGAARFATLAPGDRVRYHGPYGDFVLLPTTPSRAVFAADWVGIGPVRGILRTLFHNPDPPFPATLFHESLVPNSLAFRSEFERRQQDCEEMFTYFPTVPGGDTDWHGETRNLNELVSSQPPGPEAPDRMHWYICGSGRYTDRLQEWLAGLGVADDRLRVERFFD